MNKAISLELSSWVYVFILFFSIHISTVNNSYAADGLFGTYFENIVGSGACDPKSVVTGFYSGADMAYGSRICTDISSLLVFNTLTAPLGQALVGLTNTGSPVFGAVNWTRSGTIISYTGSRVGIGTSTPTERLDVAGNIRSTGGTLLVTNPTNTSNLRPLSLHIGYTGSTYGLLLQRTGSTANANSIIRNYGTGGIFLQTNSSTRMMLSSTGLVSIPGVLRAGTLKVGSATNPSVHGLTTTSQMSIVNTSPTVFLTDTNHRSAMLHTNNNTFYILRGSGTGLETWSSTGGFWPFQINLENNNAAFGGNVGIGTITPTAKLDVRGSVHIATQTNSQPFIISRMYKTTNHEEARLGIDDGNFHIHYINDESNSTLRLRVQNTDTESGGGVNAKDATFQFRGSGDFYVPGNIGIGTVTPTQRLDVAGNIRSTGGTLLVSNPTNTSNLRPLSLHIGYTGSTYGLQLYRTDSTANANSIIRNYGTGALSFVMSNTLRMAISNTGVVNIPGQLRIGGDASIAGSVAIDGLAQINNISILGALNTDGISNFNNNVTISNGNLILSGGTIGFTDPEKVPWMPRDSNLPFVKFGGLSYIKPQILGSFNGQVVPVSASSFFYYEQDGTLAGLRDGFNGERFGLYYMYSLEGNTADMTLTSQEYAPAFLKDTGLHAVSIVNGSSDSVTMALANGSGTIVRYVILTNILTLDPVTHTSDNVIDITNNSLFPGKACSHVSEKNIIVCTNSSVGTLYMYTLDADNNPTKIDLFNTQEGLVSNSFFNFTNPLYFERSGVFTGYLLNTPRIIQNLQYEVVGDILYAQKLFGSWSSTINGASVGGFIFRRFTVNLIYRININPASPEYGRVYYENSLPLRTDWMSPNINASVDEYSILTNAIDASLFKTYFIKAKNQVIATSSSYHSNVSFNVMRFDGVTSFISYWKSLYSGNAIYRTGIPTPGVTRVYTPYDASTLGKALSFTRFIGESRLITYAYSNRFGYAPASNWTELLLPTSNTTRTVPIFLGRTSTSSKLALPLADNIYDINTSDKSLIQQTTLDINGNIVGYIIKGNQILKYTSADDTIAPHVTLPSTYGSIIDADVLATPGRIDAVYGAPTTLTSPRARIIDDNRLIVPYIFAYNDASTAYVEKIVYNYNIYTYSASGLVLTNSSPAYNTVITATSSTKRLGVSYGSRNDSASYVTSDGTTYIGFFSNIANVVGNSIDDLMYIKLQPDGSHEDNSALLAYGAQARKSLGIHPGYGVYWTDNYQLGYAHADMYYSDVLAIPDLNTRIITSFENFIDNLPLSVILLSTVRQSDGFIIYTAKTPLFIDGSYTTLNENSYDLTLPIHGLVNNTGAISSIQNKLIYVSIDPMGNLADPSLLFTFIEPKNPVIAIIQTNLYGISNIMVKDGLDITSDNLYVKTLKVNNAIEMRGENGVYYKIYINSSGSLTVAPIIP